MFQESCAGCHQPDGSGVPGAFPPLTGNPNATDPAYVADVVRNGRQGPIEVLGATYDAVMPPISGLSDAEVEAVAAYVASLASADPGSTTTTLPPGPVAGDPAAGEDLFVGRTGPGGGPACLACHAAGPHGRAALGPDLTSAFSRLGGGPGLTAWLANPPSPTMSPIFSDRPLTGGEIADLAAYLASIDGAVPARGPDVMLLGGLGGLVLLLGLLVVWFKRPRGRYVDHLRSKA